MKIMTFFSSFSLSRQSKGYIDDDNDFEDADKKMALTVMMTMTQTLSTTNLLPRENSIVRKLMTKLFDLFSRQLFNSILANLRKHYRQTKQPTYQWTDRQALL